MKKLSDHIRKTGTAIFLDDNQAILKFPNSIVHVLSADRRGNVWFSLPKPYTDVSGMAKTFPVSMQFYNKYCDCYLKAEGVASVLADVNEMPDEHTRYIFQSDKERMMLCVSIRQMEYFARRKKGKVHHGRVLSDSISSLYLRLRKSISYKISSLSGSFSLHSFLSAFSWLHFFKLNNKNLIK